MQKTHCYTDYLWLEYREGRMTYDEMLKLASYYERHSNGMWEPHGRLVEDKGNGLSSLRLSEMEL